VVGADEALAAVLSMARRASTTVTERSEIVAPLACVVRRILILRALPEPLDSRYAGLFQSVAAREDARLVR
jgi:hypothetical protein